MFVQSDLSGSGFGLGSESSDSNCCGIRVMLEAHFRVVWLKFYLYNLVAVVLQQLRVLFFSCVLSPADEEFLLCFGRFIFISIVISGVCLIEST